MDYLILLSSIALGAVTVLWLQFHEPRRIKQINAFTGAYLLSLTMLHLLPELYRGQDHAARYGHLLIGALILAGGTGTRLWPRSRRERPKQLLPLFSDRTMLQEALRNEW